MHTKTKDAAISTMSTMAEVIPFPSAQRVGLIRMLAKSMASSGHSVDSAERMLAGRLTTQRAAMLRKGIAPNVVEREVRSLELAVRARLSEIVMRGGDAA